MSQLGDGHQRGDVRRHVRGEDRLELLLLDVEVVDGLPLLAAHGHRAQRRSELVARGLSGRGGPGRHAGPVTLPSVELAVTTHVGEHHDIDVTYGELGTWVVGNALAVVGPVRETYLVGPRDTADPAARRTEIGWPVFRMAPR
ncbi:GyrI-like domain-containing protein [Blastococcus sp. CT_GayMR16]|uniref:GyrI-like domain-containing protein n=1 Tax=Blastococcus sp. CT_GayMR16 TaxID=2559607 RepID=UPI001FD84DFC|nr:GyrI-like domain-containing protein [Blastococcus sp. CT_GayMR16]